MEVTIAGRQFEIRSVDRATVREHLKRERELPKRQGGADAAEARLDLHDWLLGHVYTEQELEGLTNRDLLDLYDAVVSWSIGASEEAVKKLFGPGDGSRTQAG